MTRTTRFDVSAPMGWLGAIGLAAAPFMPMLQLGERSLGLTPGGPSFYFALGCGVLCAVCVARRWHRALVGVGLVATAGAALLSWMTFRQFWDSMPSPLGWGTWAYPLSGLLATSAGVLAWRRAG